MIESLPADIKRIAIFRALQLGDLLCAIPAVRAIKQHFPNSDITLVGLANQKGIVTRFKHYFSDFIEFPGWPGLPERECDIRAIPDFLTYMQGRRFDLVIQMQGNGYIVNPMCLLWGGRFVAGLCREGDYCPDERLFPVMHEDEHEVKRFMKIAAALGANTSDSNLEFPVTKEEEARARELLRQMNLAAGSYVCLHGGARDPRRRWNPQYFAKLADALAAEGYNILLTGSVFECEVLDEISRRMHHPSKNLVSLFGQVELGELAALIAYSAGLVSNDTGVSHIASALRVGSVVVFSEYSDPGRWRPLDTILHHVILPEDAFDLSAVISRTLGHFRSIQKHNLVKEAD